METPVNQLDAKSLWNSLLSDVELIISPGTFNSWVAKTEGKQIENGELIVACSSPIVLRWITGKLEVLMQDMLDKKLNTHLPVKYIVDNIAKREVKKTVSNETNLFTQPTPETNEPSIETGLAKKYTFDTFLIGKNNQLAYAVCSAGADNPGKSYNPIFIYSGVGLGKTHLIQAIGNKVLENNPNAKVLYTTGEAFTNELIELLQSGKARGKYTSNKFREKYRSVDLLLIDDVQFIIGKEQTQEELFHTINTLTMQEKQIVLTSDRPPHEFTKLPPRITSRFASGMIADIQAPDMEMRSAILRKKRDANGDKVPNEVIDYIAQNLPTNIRELEGAYIKYVTEVKGDEKRSFSIESAADVLKTILKVEQKKPVNSQQIIKGVCTYYDIKTADIKGKKRTKELVIPRQIAMYLMYEITKLPYMSIGDALGGRDHTTILHGVKKVEEQLRYEERVREQVEAIKALIYSG